MCNDVELVSWSVSDNQQDGGRSYGRRDNQGGDRGYRQDRGGYNRNTERGKFSGMCMFSACSVVCTFS